MQNKMVVISASISREKAEELDRIIKTRNYTSRSEAIRAALYEWIEKEKEEKK